MAYGDEYQLDVASEVMRLTTPGIPGSPLGRIASYGGDGFGGAVPGNETEDSAALAEALDYGIAALAAERGLSNGQMKDALLTFTGGSRDPETVASAAIFLSEQCKGEEISLSEPTAAERHAAAAKGHALPDGSYPVRNKRELHAAAVLAASGHGDAVGAKKLIKKRAAELGVPVESLPGFGHDEDGDGDHDPSLPKKKKGKKKRPRTDHRQMANGVDGADSFGSGGGETGGPDGGGGASMSGMSSDELRLAARDRDTAAGVIARNPMYFAGKKGQGAQADPGKTTGSRPPFEIHDAGTSCDDPDDEVERYLVIVRQQQRTGKLHKQAIRDSKGYGANSSHGPTPYVNKSGKAQS